MESREQPTSQALGARARALPHHVHLHLRSKQTQAGSDTSELLELLELQLLQLQQPSADPCVSTHLLGLGSGAAHEAEGS